MRNFTCNSFNEIIVDLDDPKTYEHLPQTVDELRDKMFAEIGYVICYMDFWHKDIFNGKQDNGQRNRVKLLIKNFTKNERVNRENVLWYQEQIFILQDEIENMC